MFTITFFRIFRIIFFVFLTVGSGSGGSPVAGRLSEVADWQVLVLEAGGQPPPEATIPGMAPFMILEGHESDWQYRTTRQTHSQFNYVNNVSGKTTTYDVNTNAKYSLI